MSSAVFPQIINRATEPYQQAGKFAWHFARGKLGGDPAFANLLRLGLLKDNDRILDIGCGQGLLAACLLAAEEQAKQSWPADWAPAPRGLAIHGIELMPKDVQRARDAHGNNPRATFECADMCNASFPPSEAVVILDVLHYVPIAAQDDVLRRIVACLQAGENKARGQQSRLLLRVGDKAAGLPFKVSNWVDAVVTTIRGHRLSTLYCRTVKEWTATLESLGFTVKPMPMHEGTPFANIMLVCELK
jgi:SAM-dependent methyltransferase